MFVCPLFRVSSISDTDDLPRYRDTCDGSPVTVSRGTCTREYHVIHRATSPLQFPAEGKVGLKIKGGIINFTYVLKLRLFIPPAEIRDGARVLPLLLLGNWS